MTDPLKLQQGLQFNQRHIQSQFMLVGWTLRKVAKKLDSYCSGENNVSILKYSNFCLNYELVISVHFLLLHAVGDENEEYLVFSFIQNNLS